MKRSILLSALVLCGCSALVSPAFASSTGDDMTVTLDVTPSCTLSVGDLDFPAVTTFTTGASVTGSATLTVACTEGAEYQIALNLGANASSTQRRLRNTGATNEYLNYGLYSENTTYTTPWGSTLDDDTVPGVGTGADDSTHTIYGKVPSGQVVSAGAYTDTVTATIWYDMP